jgi:hypothetical protein
LTLVDFSTLFTVGNVVAIVSIISGISIVYIRLRKGFKDLIDEKVKRAQDSANNETRWNTLAAQLANIEKRVMIANHNSIIVRNALLAHGFLRPEDIKDVE